MENQSKVAARLYEGKPLDSLCKSFVGGFTFGLALSMSSQIQAEDCTDNSFTPGQHTIYINHDGQSRKMLINIPQSYDGSEAVPLLIDAHGINSSAEGHRDRSNWLEQSNDHGFILVYPEGINLAWNGQGCCNTSYDDEGFMVAIVNYMKENASINGNRVYMTGYSNGGALTNLMACKHGDLFAAFMPVAFSLVSSGCIPAQPVSVMTVAGRNDYVVRYNGGWFPSMPQTLSDWADISGCSGQPEFEDLGGNGQYSVQLYSSCGAGKQVGLVSTSGNHAGENTFPQTYEQTEYNIGERGWEWLNQFTLNNAGEDACSDTDPDDGDNLALGATAYASSVERSL